MKESAKLRQIMQTILTLGNALNQGTARGIQVVLLVSSYMIFPFASVGDVLYCVAGSAVGFKLDSLLKLSDTRARNNKMTLMHYLCKVNIVSLIFLITIFSERISAL